MKHDTLLSGSPGWIVPLVLAVAVAAGACNTSAPEDGGGGSGTDVSATVALGWAAWEAADYTTAFDHFEDAFNQNTTSAEARNGLGWAELFLGNMSAAIYHFDYAMYLELPVFDAHLGMAIALRDSAHYSNAILTAEQILAAIPRYEFSHRPSINYKDLRLLIAACAIRRGENYFDLAQTNVDSLDPANGLDPEVPASWIVGGVTYATYPEALIKKIEALEAVIDP